MKLRYLFIVLVILFLFPVSRLSAQTISGKVVDESTGMSVPFVRLTHPSMNTTVLTDPQGNFTIPLVEYIYTTHPLFYDMKVDTNGHDSVLVIELHKKNEVQLTEDQISEGLRILDNYHTYLPITSTTRLPEFEFISTAKIEILEQSPENKEKWIPLNSLETIEKNRFKYPNRKYARVVRAHFSDGDSSKLGFIPINIYTLSEEEEYINFSNLKYYNPLYQGANKRYEYGLIDTFIQKNEQMYVLLFRPKPKKHFIGLTGLLYFKGDRSEIWGGYLLPQREYDQDFFLSFYKAITSKNTRFLKDLHIELHLKDIPTITKDSRIVFSSWNTLPVFDFKGISNSRWVDMALFDYEKDTAGDDTWMMTQIVNRERLEYIKKDTSDQKFVLSNTLRWMYNIYDGKLGYRVSFFDVKNLFAINKFEAIRIGLGLQSHESLSDVFTFGGYIGYGIGDGKFKYGGNVGVYFGKERSNLLSISYTRDLLEPGLIYYMDKKHDLVHDFFTSRMDDYFSTQITLRTRINKYITTSLVLNNYALQPLYDYIYNPWGGDPTETQNFNFTESSFLLNIGTPFSDNPNLRNLLYRKKRFRSNLFLNFTKGWEVENAGDFSYFKLNGRLNSNIRINRDEIDVVFEGGAMTPNQPYQINYTGPGTEFKLTGIIIKNAFQTMKLYGFFADRYVHSFINYNFGKLFTKKVRFNPDLALAFNLGWGRLKGRKEIHENIDVRDYPDGYYEAGFLINNLLRLKIYNYFYGGLGIGTFVGFGPDAEKGAIALRLSYELGAL